MQARGFQISLACILLSYNLTPQSLCVSRHPPVLIDHQMQLLHSLGDLVYP